ncbi:MAG: anthranilate synthase component I family protein [Clostridiales bacterium]|nr:anthranilate synthase component I family protein [Clostridiales bacterium]
MIYPQYKDLQVLRERYNTIPLTLEMYSDVATPISVLKKLNSIYECCFLLESVEGGEVWGRYSFLGYDPLIRVSYKDGLVRIRRKGETPYETTEETREPYQVLRRIQAEFSVPKLAGLPPFTGGFVGYFSYSMLGIAQPKLKISSGSFYDYDVMLFDKLIAFDHKKQKIYIIYNIGTQDLDQNYDHAVSALKKTEAMIKESLHYSSQSQASTYPISSLPKKINFTSSFTKEEYCSAVEKTKEYIRKGQIFQAVISNQYTAPYEESLLNPYRVLRTTNPSPYMVYMNIYGDEIMCSSPETLVSLVDGKLITFPVAGSRPRGRTEEEDKALERELLADPKELSEHNMLVELGVDELKEISKPGSAKVTDYMMVHRYSKIMHICSRLEGEILPDKDGFDALKALLPAGTLAGVPKVEACQIIEDLETRPRGIYGGALGYFDFAGNMDTCIAIRMAVKKDNLVYVQAGGGIVAGSVPEKEFQEAQNKAGAILDALRKANDLEENRKEGELK